MNKSIHQLMYVDSVILVYKQFLSIPTHTKKHPLSPNVLITKTSEESGPLIHIIQEEPEQDEDYPFSNGDIIDTQDLPIEDALIETENLKKSPTDTQTQETEDSDGKYILFLLT